MDWRTAFLLLLPFVTCISASVCGNGTSFLDCQIPSYSTLGCIYYNYTGEGLCKLAPYCHPSWSQTICENISNYGSCIFNSSTMSCDYRAKYLDVINVGISCDAACINLYNNICPFCGTKGYCCTSYATPKDGCIPVIKDLACAPPVTYTPTRSPSNAPTSPTASPSVSSPTLFPISSFPTDSPTASDLNVVDQALWENFRAQFPESTYCNRPGSACFACDPSDQYRRIVCGSPNSRLRRLGNR